METLEVIDQKNNETRAVLPAEAGHWYDKNGNPVYEVEAKKGGMSATKRRARYLSDMMRSENEPGIFRQD